MQAAKRMGPGRDRILNDVMNTVVAAALIGGFALGNISGVSTVGEKTIDKIIYMLSFVAVHACTCSCLTSAMTCVCFAARTPCGLLQGLPIGRHQVSKGQQHRGRRLRAVGAGQLAPPQAVVDEVRHGLHGLHYQRHLPLVEGA